MAKKTNFETNGKEYYRVRAQIGIDDQGKQIMKVFYGTSKKGAELKRDEYFANLRRGMALDYDKLKFSDFFSNWLDIVHRPTLAQSSYNRYDTIHRIWISQSSFYTMKLTAIKSMNIQQYMNTIDKVPTAEKMYMLLSSFFKYCIRERVLTFNPMDNVRKPKQKQVESKKHLDRDEITLLTEAYSADQSLFVYLFALFTGLRQGEILALTHADIENDLIKVNKTLNRVKKDGRNQVIVTAPKTPSSIRMIPLFDELKEPLKRHVILEKEKHLRLGIHFSKSNHLFTANNCSPIRGDRLTSRWRKLQNQLGIEEDVNFHALRHTFCTLLASKGVPLKTAATLMGHSGIETTARIYTHVDVDSKIEAIKLLSGIM